MSVSKKHILVVDDITENIEIMKSILMDGGYDISSANNGREALDKIENNNYDLILLDVMMPLINGYEVCREVKSDSNNKDLPIIFITAKGDSESIVEGLRMGASDYITKPFEPEEVLLRVQNQLKIHDSRIKLLQMSQELHEQNEVLSKKNLEYEELQKLFRQYTPRATWSHILDTFQNHEEDKKRCREVEVTMLFGDISKFTKFAEKYSAMEVLESLNEIFKNITNIVYKYGGDVDKFIGDAIFAVFKDPFDCIKAAWEITKGNDRINDERMMNGKTPLYIRMGINTGAVVRGDIGGETRKDNTLIGDAVNITQRLESSSYPGQILISDKTYNLIKDQVKVSEGRKIEVKGREKPILSYFLEGILKESESLV